jgi:hypothetical protein
LQETSAQGIRPDEPTAECAAKSPEKTEKICLS